MKKTVSILIALIMLFSLAACGQSSTNENNETHVSAGESVQPSTESPEESTTPDFAPDNTEIPTDAGKILT